MRSTCSRRMARWRVVAGSSPTRCSKASRAAEMANSGFLIWCATDRTSAPSVAMLWLCRSAAAHVRHGAEHRRSAPLDGDTDATGDAAALVVQRLEAHQQRGVRQVEAEIAHLASEHLPMRLLDLGLRLRRRRHHPHRAADQLRRRRLARRQSATGDGHHAQLRVGGPGEAGDLAKQQVDRSRLLVDFPLTPEQENIEHEPSGDDEQQPLDQLHAGGDGRGRRGVREQPLATDDPGDAEGDEDQGESAGTEAARPARRVGGRGSRGGHDGPYTGTGTPSTTRRTASRAASRSPAPRLSTTRWASTDGARRCTSSGTTYGRPSTSASACAAR